MEVIKFFGKKYIIIRGNKHFAYFCAVENRTIEPFAIKICGKDFKFPLWFRKLTKHKVRFKE